MRIPKRKTQFKKDIKLAKRRGKDLNKLENDSIIFERTGTHSDLFE